MSVIDYMTMRPKEWAAERSIVLPGLILRFGFMVLLGLLASSFSAAWAKSCREKIQELSIACMQERGVDQGPACWEEASRNVSDCNSSGASSPDEDSPEACEREGKISVDWVFSDKGARATYSRFRNDGYTQFDAVVAAQGHNPSAQEQLRRCRGWVEGYIASKKAAGPQGMPSMTDRALSSEDCRCISVLPEGKNYSVTNSCDPMKVAVLFIDALNSEIKVTRSAGIIGGNRPKIIARPNMGLPSIAAIGLQSSRTKLSCPMTLGPN